jgi:GDP-L-fucose synthase
MKEDALLTSSLEPTNEAYALAKICGIRLCQAYAREYGANFISAMPTNLYGPGDSFDLQTSHVLPALIHKIHLAKEKAQPSVTLWGTGAVYREFLHVDDVAEACLFLMETYDSPELVNVGSGHDLTIRDLAGMVGKAVGYSGQIEWDATKPDGTPRKLLDVSKLNQLGWKAKIPLEEGLRATYQWWLEHGRVS